jgi:hypothetical protein
MLKATTKYPQHNKVLLSMIKFFALPHSKTIVFLGAVQVNLALWCAAIRNDFELLLGCLIADNYA